MEVLILSKTKYGSTQVCVGGICTKNNQFIRLLNQGGYYQPSNTKFNIGDIWDISFTPVSIKREPHNEDVIISTYTFLRKIYSLETYIKNMGVPIWTGNVTNIFEGKIKWTGNGKGYFSENIKNYPCNSVGFWISDIDLQFQNGFYVYEQNGIRKQIVYKGNQNIIQVIPKGKLIRLSLAKWWKPEDTDIEARCYLQLSGWYDDIAEPAKAAEIKPTVKIEQKLVFEPLNRSYEKSTPPNLITNKPIIKAESKQVLEPITGNREIPKPIVPRPILHTPTYNQNQSNTPISKINNNPSENKKTTSNKSTKNTSGPCYIATLCYGDYYADEVCIFRDFRDKTLKKSYFGRKFITVYYKIAPKLTNELKDYTLINSTIKHTILNPLLTIIKKFRFNK